MKEVYAAQKYVIYQSSEPFHHFNSQSTSSSLKLNESFLHGMMNFIIIIDQNETVHLKMPKFIVGDVKH